MKTILIVFGCLLVVIIARARLGENPVQIYERYGPIAKREEITAGKWRGFYHFKNYAIIVTFYEVGSATNEVSVMEAVAPLDGRTFSDDEAAELRESISGSKTWSKSDSEANYKGELWHDKGTGDVSIRTTSLAKAAGLLVGTKQWFVDFTNQISDDEKDKTTGF